MTMVRVSDSMNFLRPDTLIASLVWGAVGSGYFIYGWRQQAFLPMVAGVVLTATSYFAETGLTMTLISIGTIVATHFLMKRMD